MGIALLLALVPLMAIAYTTTCWLLGRRVLGPPRSRFVSFLVGWAILRAVALIPVFGLLVWLGATIFGLGVSLGAVAARTPAAPPRHATPSGHDARLIAQKRPAWLLPQPGGFEGLAVVEGQRPVLGRDKQRRVAVAEVTMPRRPMFFLATPLPGDEEASEVARPSPVAVAARLGLIDDLETVEEVEAHHDPTLRPALLRHIKKP